MLPVRRVLGPLWCRAGLARRDARPLRNHPRARTTAAQVGCEALDRLDFLLLRSVMQQLVLLLYALVHARACRSAALQPKRDYAKVRQPTLRVRRFEAFLSLQVPLQLRLQLLLLHVCA